MATESGTITIDGLVDELARVLWDAEQARTLVRRVGFPPGNMPSFSTAQVFWAQVIENASNGMLLGGVHALVDEVVKRYPGNVVFTGYRAQASASSQGGDPGMRLGLGSAHAGARRGQQVSKEDDLATSRRRSAGPLVGRAAEVRAFSEFLVDEHLSVLNLYGPGGIGKTVLAGMCNDEASALGARSAVVDGSLSTGGPVDLLVELAQALAGSGVGEAAGLHTVVSRCREHQALEAMVAAVGGSASLYDPLGTPRDAGQLQQLSRRFLGEASPGVRAALQNGFAMERHLRRGERVLTDTFLDTLCDAALRDAGPLVLLLDTYECLEDIDDWLFQQVATRLPERFKLVILGRNALEQVSFDWGEMSARLHTRELGELSSAEATEWLRYHGLSDDSQIHRILDVTGGYPLLLTLSGQLAREAGGWDYLAGLERSADRDRMATALLSRILQEERVHQVRTFLELGCLARWFDPEVVAVVLDTDLARGREVYDRIRRHSFVVPHPCGLRFHDKVRDLMEARLRFTSQELYDQVQGRLAALHARRSGRQWDPQGTE